MENLCQSNCCSNCLDANQCKGCIATNGHPFCKDCIAAEIIKENGLEAFKKETKKVIQEINALHLLPNEINQLYLLNGDYVNLTYIMENGEKIKFLKDKNIYLGTQVEQENSTLCFGVVASLSFILISQYDKNGANPELILYKKRI